MNLVKKTRKGFALIFVLLIAALMMVPVLMLLSSVAPRRTSVSGEALSDRVLSVCDGTIDRVLSQINALPGQFTSDSTIRTGLANIGTYYTKYPPSGGSAVVNEVAEKYVMAYLLSGLNGGTAAVVTMQNQFATIDPAALLQAGATNYADATVVDRSGTIWDIEDNVSTYLYNLDTQQYYAVWTGITSTGTIGHVVKTGINGDITTSAIKNLATGAYYTGIGDVLLDPQFRTDNKWVEVDTNTQYTDNGQGGPGSTMFKIRTSAYLLSSGNGAGAIVRNVLAEATLQLNGTSGSSGGSGPTASGPFKYAIFSGTTFMLNGAHTVTGDIFAGVDPTATTAITVNGINTVTGNIETSLKQSSTAIQINGLNKVGNSVYGQQETIPDFQAGTEANVAAVAKAAGSRSGDFTQSGVNIVTNVTGSNYNIGGSVNISGTSNTVRLYPLANASGPKVDWYIGGNLTISGANATIDFGTTPGIIWVHGSITLNGVINVVGTGTIVADGDIICNGVSSSGSNKLAIISEATDTQAITLNGNQNWHGLFYAPKGGILVNGTGAVVGSVAAGRSVVINGTQNVTYDASLTSGSGTGLIYPTDAATTAGVSFSSSTRYRLSWRETIANPVTNANIASTAELALPFACYSGT